MYVKPIVRYTGQPLFYHVFDDVEVARVYGLDHPSLGEDIITTSRILSKNVDGSFETLNTFYVPLNNEKTSRD